MKAVVLLSFLCFCGLLQATSADNTINSLIKIIILYLESVLVYYKTIRVLPNSSLSVNTTMTKGSFECQGVYLFGLEGLEIKNDFSHITVDLDLDAHTAILGLNISIPSKVGVQITGYEADVGIVNEIPIYGTGDISLTMKSIKIDIFTEIDFSEKLKLTKLDVRPVLNFVQVNLDGFWNNSEISDILSTVLTGLADVLVVFWNFEINCVSCALSSLLESLLAKSQDPWTDLQTHCKETCESSSHPFVSEAFKSNISEIMRNISDDDVLGYIETAKDYFIKSIESHV